MTSSLGDLPNFVTTPYKLLPLIPFEPENIVIGLQQGSTYSLLALGYTLVYGVLQLINFAHSEVFMSGGFGSYLVVNGIVGNRHLTGATVPLTVFAGVVSALSAYWIAQRHRAAGTGQQSGRLRNA